MKLIFLYLAAFIFYVSNAKLVINTWNLPGAAETAWNTLINTDNAINSLEDGCTFCEETQCNLAVGFGSRPDEHGETTLDALIFDGETMDAGAVGALRRVKNAISVAKHVLQNTDHTLLVGDQATDFAIAMGFKEEDLSTNYSIGLWEEWLNNSCQPNHWINVAPDPTKSCGPYTPLPSIKKYLTSKERDVIDDDNHDTIGMIVLNNNGHIVAGTSTNGLRNKIPGRVGDSPIPGAGAYADNSVGAACATGDGDIMIRFLPSFLAVELMRNGLSPTEAAKIAIARITASYPEFSGAVIAVSVRGDYGAACNGMVEFPYAIRNDNLNEVTVYYETCTNAPQWKLAK